MYIKFDLPSFETLSGWRADINYTGTNGSSIDRFVAQYEPDGGFIVVDRDHNHVYTLDRYEATPGRRAQELPSAGPGAEYGNPVESRTTEYDDEARQHLEDMMATLNPEIKWGALYARQPEEGEVWQFVRNRSSGEVVAEPGETYAIGVVTNVNPATDVVTFKIIIAGDSGAVPDVGDTVREQQAETARNPEWVCVPDDFHPGMKWFADLTGLLD